MVAGKLSFAIRDKRDLMHREFAGDQVSNAVHEIVQRVALNIELFIWPGLH